MLFRREMVHALELERVCVKMVIEVTSVKNVSLATTNIPRIKPTLIVEVSSVKKFTEESLIILYGKYGVRSDKIRHTDRWKVSS